MVKLKATICNHKHMFSIPDISALCSLPKLILCYLTLILDPCVTFTCVPSKMILFINSSVKHLITEVSRNIVD